MEPGRNSQAEYKGQLYRVDLEPGNIQVDCPFVTHHAEHYKGAGNRLGDYCGGGHSCHIPFEIYDKYQVQDNVDDPCYSKVVERPPGVSHRPQYGAAEVVDQSECDSHEIDLKVHCGLFQHLGRCLHPQQYLPGSQYTHHSYCKAAVKRQQHGGVYCLVQILFIPCTVVSGRQYVCTNGESQKQVDHKLYDSVVGAYGGQGVVPGKPAHYYYIRSIEQELQGGGAHERYGKQAYLLKKRAMAHIDLIVLRHIYIFLSSYIFCQG